MKETKQIGSVYVDAGLIWVGDPCYIWPDDEKQPAITHEVGDWRDLCAKLDATPYPHHYNFNGLGVIATSGLGDGIYPVYAEIEDGVIHSITINFFEDEDEDKEEE